MWRYLHPLAQACIGTHVDVAGARIRVPGPLPIRLSVVAGNIRMHRVLDELLQPGDTAVDVGANIGYNAVYAALRVGPQGRVIAVEPAADNVRVLRDNIVKNDLQNVVVEQVAAGRTREIRDLFLRGDLSAVNSLFEESVYASVTGVEKVPVIPLDALVDGQADLVKIDVEGAELDVLAGMRRLLGNPRIRLVVEWHPRLQEAAGYPAEVLPRLLVENRFRLRAVSHTSDRPLNSDAITAMARHLRSHGRPVELVATR